ncbi:hypothetical protein ACLIYM_25415 [Streptomyces fenghuangensis]
MTSTRPLPDHGTLYRRKHHRCDCQPCIQRERDYTNHRRRLQAYGRWQPFVDAEPIRAHVRMLMSYGIGWQRTARLAGVSNGGLSRLLYGTYGGDRPYPPSKRVRTATADKILAVKPSFDNLAPNRRVDGTGTRRRLQALVAIGWPQTRLAQQLGISTGQLWRDIHGGAVRAATARAVRGLYDQLWNVDPASRGVPKQCTDMALATASTHGWAPPAAWDDDYIDSPAARPDLGERIDRYEALAEDAQWLIDDQGYDRKRAANRLGVTLRHLDRALAHGRQQYGEAA